MNTTNAYILSGVKNNKPSSIASSIMGETTLADYFNSDFATWLFNGLFHTHKILRGDLELMPIFSECNMPNNVFCEQRLLDYLGIDLSVLK